jgi:hypothetical protein
MNVKVCPDCGTHNPEDAWTCMGRSCVAILSVADIVELQEPHGQVSESPELAAAVSGNGNGSAAAGGIQKSDILDPGAIVGPAKTLVAVQAPEPGQVAEAPDFLEVPVEPDIAEASMTAETIEVVQGVDGVADPEPSEPAMVEEVLEPESIMAEEAVESVEGADHLGPVDPVAIVEETPTLDELLDALETEPVDPAHSAVTPEASAATHPPVMSETAYDFDALEATEPETAEPEDVIEPDDADEAVAAAEALPAAETLSAGASVAAEVATEEHESGGPPRAPAGRGAAAPVVWAAAAEPFDSMGSAPEPEESWEVAGLDPVRAPAVEEVRSGEPTSRATPRSGDRTTGIGLHLRDVSGSGRAVFVLSVLAAVAGMVFLLAGVVGGPTDTMRMAPVLLGLGCVMLAVVLALWGIAEQLGRLWNHLQIVASDLRRET